MCCTDEFNMCDVNQTQERHWNLNGTRCCVFIQSGLLNSCSFTYNMVNRKENTAHSPHSAIPPAATIAWHWDKMAPSWPGLRQYEQTDCQQPQSGHLTPHEVIQSSHQTPLQQKKLESQTLFCADLTESSFVPKSCPGWLALTVMCTHKSLKFENITANLTHTHAHTPKLMIYKGIYLFRGINTEIGVCLHLCIVLWLSVHFMQDSEAASCKMNSLGSNHSIPSTSVSTGSQSSSVNSMQEVLDDSCSDMTMMHPQDYSTLESSPHTKKVKFKGDGWVVGRSNVTPNHPTRAGN